MEACSCLCWSRGSASNVALVEPEPFSLPAPLPGWPQGEGFAMGSICIGELEVRKITIFQGIWSCHLSKKKSGGAIFYKPSEIPEGFYCLGHYGQQCHQPLQGFVLVVRENINFQPVNILPALQRPLDYAMVWSSSDLSEEANDGCGCFWLPLPPEGYKSLGYVVTNGPQKPSVDEVRCVRSDLTDTCEAYDMIIDMETIFHKLPCRFWKMRPCSRGMIGKGICTGTFYCGIHSSCEDELDVYCLKNLDPSLKAMPCLEQIDAMIKHYGPTVMFHPEEIYLPSSVSWFFENGATLYQQDVKLGENIDAEGSNLPSGGENDGLYWLDLPDDDRCNIVKKGNLDSAKLYVHVKPAYGGTFTDIAMWVFCPFNGPVTIKVALANFPLNKVGEHVGDWEHFTLRISNFTGELWSIYFSQHSGGEWVDACNLEFLEGNKAVVYSSKSGHANFPHPGNHLQGSTKLGIGVRNDTEQSNYTIDSSIRYQIVAAEHLGDAINEPNWLNYMREWGPTIMYDSRSELDKILSFLPFILRFTVENIFDSLPMELFHEEGPTGPKEKDNWVGDERC